MIIKALLVKAFTQDPSQGNPAGVILNADELSEEQMIFIAAHLGFSESAFVSHSDSADVRVRFFTPQEEVALCGHATIATAHILKEMNLVQKEYLQETGAGVLSVALENDGKAFMEQANPIFSELEENRERIANLLGLQVKDLLDYPIQAVSTGSAAKLIIPVVNLEILHSIKPDLAGISLYDQEHGGRGFYPFTSDVLERGSDFHARQFNPFIGIDEDPITGVAAGPLGCYVRKHGLTEKETLVIEQGFIMNKGGKMYLDLRSGVRVGGYAVTYGEEKLELISDH